MPLATVGALLGSVAMSALIGSLGSPLTMLILAADAVITLALVWLAITVAVRVTRPWAVRATSVGNVISGL